MFNAGFKMKISHIAGARETIQKVTQHEVGHYIAARIFGFKTGDLSLELTDLAGAHNGGAVIELVRSLDNIEKIKNYIEERIIILYAGVLSENMNNGTIDQEAANESLKTTGANDFAKVRELLNLLNSILYTDEKDAQKELEKINDNLWGKALKLVEQESKLIEGVASKFASFIKETHTKYILSEKDLEKIPNLQKRFSD